MDLNMPGCDGVAATGASPPSTRAPASSSSPPTPTTNRSSARCRRARSATSPRTRPGPRSAAPCTPPRRARRYSIPASSSGCCPPPPARRGAGAAAPGVPGAAGADDELTPREAEVLRLIAAGQSNREIARTLFVSEATVKTHVNRIFAKTGSRDRAQADPLRLHPRLRGSGAIALSRERAGRAERGWPAGMYPGGFQRRLHRLGDGAGRQARARIGARRPGGRDPAGRHRLRTGRP